MSVNEDIGFDVYSVIKSAEIREYLRKGDSMDFFEKEQLILHSYTSVQQKMDMLKQLSQTGNEEERKSVNEMLCIYREYTDLIYHPVVRTIFLLEYVEPRWESGKVNRGYQGIWAVCDTLDEVTEELESIFAGEEESGYGYVGVIHVPQNEKVKLPYCFRMFWIDEKWQIKDMRIKDTELETRRISEDIRYRLEDIVGRHPLPFQNGDRLKIQMPFMKEPFYGIIWSELDGNGCWYHWLNRNEEEGECVDLSYIEFNYCSGYSTLDWVERAP